MAAGWRGRGERKSVLIMTSAITTPAKRGERVAPYRWKKGQSGNPRGKAKGTVSLAYAVQRLLRKEPDKLESVARTLVDAAIAGDVSAARLLFERLDGHKPTGFFSVSIDNSDRRSFTVSPQVLSEIAEARRRYEEKILCPH
jgi:Family of unknown function (DUF5681)